MIKTENLFSTGGMAESERSLHTPGSFARQNLLYVQEVGRLQSLHPHRCIREKVDSFLFLVVLEGRGNLTIKGKNYGIQKGDCALLDCMEHYEHISDEQDAWRLAWVHFNGQAARSYYELFLKSNEGNNIFSTEDIEKWNSIIGQLLEKQKDKSLAAELLSGELLLHLVNLLVECVSGSESREGENDKQIAEQIREYLNEGYSHALVLEEMEQEFRQAPAELNRLFYKYFGISIEEYISNRRFNAAKELLRFTIKPIDAVAAEAGISDMVNLQQLFRENEGMTAEEYRMKWAQWIR